jgi:flagellar FliL protein
MPQEEAKSERTSEAVPEQHKKSSFVKLAILGIVVTVIGVECTLAFFVLSSAGNATEHVSEPSVAKGEGKGESKDKEAKHEGKAEAKGNVESELNGDADPSDQVEVVLGEFSVTAFQPATNTTLRIEFSLYGAVGAKEQKEFMTALEENQHRFREQVIVIVRSAEITDLTDAGLGLIKRKIMEKTNRMIGKSMLHSVIFSDFSFIEQ